MPGRLVASLHNHSGAIAHPGVAGRAVDVEPLLAPRQHLHGNRKGKRVGLLAFDQAGVEKAVFAQLAASDRVRDLRPNRAAIGKEGGAALGNEFGLVLHVLAAAGARQGG